MYEPSRDIATFHVSGFQHYEGCMVLQDMKVGDSLRLEPEIDNPYDPEAIALFFGDAKIGYVPKKDNDIISLLCCYGHADAFEATILSVRPEEEPWHQVYARVSVRDNRG